MFEDEARFGRVNIARKCWAPRGTRPRVDSQIIHEYIYVYAAVSPVDGMMDSLILPEVNSAILRYFFRKYLPDIFQNISLCSWMVQAGIKQRS